MLLALASGTTISMAQLATTLYALALGVDSARLGIIAAMEPLGIALMTLPAGLLVARYARGACTSSRAWGRCCSISSCRLPAHGR